MNRSILKYILPVVILAGGALAAGGLMALSPKTSKGTPEAKALPVEVLLVKEEAAPAKVVGTGVVSPDQEVTVLPQVGGQIVEVSPKLIPGGRFAKGELLARIDHRDYKLALRAEESRVKSAELDLALEKKRSGIAEREWALLGDDIASTDTALALRKPQLALSQVSLESAISSKERALLSLQRTRLKAPFNAVVMQENIDLGQVVGTGTQVARLVGADRFRVMVSLPVEDLTAIQVPGVNAETGSTARIVQRLGESKSIVRTGEVLRVSGELDAQTRRAQVLVSVEAPMDGPDGGLPMLPGAYVEVEIAGRSFEGVFRIPRGAVRQGKEVWIVDDAGTLASRQVQILWGDDQYAVVSGGLSAGDKLVISALSLPIAGTPVNVTRTQDSL